MRVETEFGAGLRDRDHAVVVGDVVDPSRAARHREQRRLRGGIDVQRRPRRFVGYQVPGP